MTTATVENGKLRFSSPLSEHRFMELAEGKEVKLEVVEKPTNRMWRFFHGCLVPAMFYWHPFSGWIDFSEAREAMKLQFFPGVKSVKLAFGDDGGVSVQVAPSLSTMSKERFTQAVESITSWMMENGMPYELLDSEEYLRWRDTNDTDLVYPPLQRLKDAYEKQRA